MTKYAAQTIVPVDRSKAEIERILMRYGATSFAYGWEGDRAMVGFQMRGRRIVFKLGMPLPDEFGETPTGKARCDEAILRTHSQACRQRWRALALVIKAKLEAVESGIASFEDEFLAHTLLPSGATVSEWIQPQVAEAYETGRMPRMLPLLTEGK